MNSKLIIKQGESMSQSTPCSRFVASVNKLTEMWRRESFQNIFIQYILLQPTCHWMSWSYKHKTYIKFIQNEI